MTDLAQAQAKAAGGGMRAPMADGRPASVRLALVLAGLAALTAIGIAALQIAPLGPLTRHMSLHIVLMNLAAPVAALALAGRGWRAPGLWAASVVQIALLYAWHAPPALAAAHASPAIMALASASLFAAAIWFWMAVLDQPGGRRWRAILALLITGKLFCLLGVLLVFAPRALYPAHAQMAAGGALDDQHLAGLLMLGACPLTYVLAGVVAAARWLDELAEADASGPVR